MQVGYQEEVLPKIFDAYFTTKHKSQGTGLGLYMSYQIITNRFSSGTIDVENEEYEYLGEEYKGANFKIIFPFNKFKITFLSFQVKVNRNCYTILHYLIEYKEKFIMKVFTILALGLALIILF
jgi:hypothetical protein